VDEQEITMRQLSILLAALLCCSPLSAAEPTNAPPYYGVLIIDRNRLEVATTCDIGIYLQDRLAARIYQGQSASFNLPAGQINVRLGYMGGLGCEPSFEQIRSTHIQIQTGVVHQYRMALDAGGLTVLRIQP
jgi:hypothetical protein